MILMLSSATSGCFLSQMRNLNAPRTGLTHWLSGKGEEGGEQEFATVGGRVWKLLGMESSLSAQGLPLFGNLAA